MGLETAAFTDGLALHMFPHTASVPMLQRATVPIKVPDMVSLRSPSAFAWDAGAVQLLVVSMAAISQRRTEIQRLAFHASHILQLLDGAFRLPSCHTNR